MNRLPHASDPLKIYVGAEVQWWGVTAVDHVRCVRPCTTAVHVESAGPGLGQQESIMAQAAASF